MLVFFQNVCVAPVDLKMEIVIVQDDVLVRLGLLVKIAGAVLQDLMELIVQIKRVNHFLITLKFSLTLLRLGS